MTPTATPSPLDPARGGGLRADAMAPGAPRLADPDAFLDRVERQVRSGRVLDRAEVVLLDALAVECARGRGAFDLAVGELLDVLDRTGGVIKVGPSGVGDLAREKLGLAADYARRLARNARKLSTRPLLRRAVLRGEVTPRKAEVVFDKARAGDEAYWVERAKMDTVRQLEAAVKREPDPDEVEWHRIRQSVKPEDADVVEVALQLAGILVGPTAPRWKRIEVLSMEFLSGFPIEPLEQIAPRPPPCPPRSWAAPARPPSPSLDSGPPPRTGARDAPPVGATDMACGFQRPSAELLRPAPEPEGDPSPPDPHAILARLRRLVRDRALLDERLARAALLIQRLKLWRLLDCTSFELYCAERLGLAASTVRQRIALERRMVELPPLREAVRSGRLSYEQARQVARVATPTDVATRIEEAAATTCVALRRELDAEEDQQMWRAGELRAVVPEPVESLFADALRSAQRARPGLTPGEALVFMALHCIEVWWPTVQRLLAATDDAILRDGGLCQVPGCERAADHLHHIVFRSAGGPTVGWNELGLCAAHHLQGIHQGHIHVSGRAPDQLVWVLAEGEVVTTGAA